MKRYCALWFAFCACSAIATAQVGEFSLSGGVSRFGGKSLGTIGNDITSGNININNGFRLALRFTLNSYRFFGHEFGYAYSRSGLKLPASAAAQPATPGQQTQSSSDISVPIHQGMYNFLVYATPEGTHVRPFATGGVHFSSFFPPGASAYYGNQITKFGFNYGGGIKFRMTSVWGARLDFRQYNTGQPFDFPNQQGRLKQTEISGGVSFNF